MNHWKIDIILIYINEITIFEHNNKFLFLNKQLQTPITSSIISDIEFLSHSTSSHSLGR